MKTLIIWMLFLFLNINIAFAQHNDLKDQGLNGKVKSVTEWLYDSVYYNGNLLQPKDSTKFLRRTYAHFNTQGFIDSTIEYDGKGGGAFYTLSRFIGGKKVSESAFSRYTKSSKKSSGKWKLADTINVTWIDQFSYTSKTYDLKGKLLTQETVWLDSTFREKKREKKYLAQGSVIVSGYTVEYLFLDDVLIETIQHKFGENIDHRIFFKHLRFDNHHNSLLIEKTYSERYSYYIEYYKKIEEGEVEVLRLIKKVIEYYP